MRTPLCLAAIPLLAGVAFAQDAKPATAGGQAGASGTEVQTQIYRGTLVDASCSGSGAAGTGAGSPASTDSSGGTQKKSKSAPAGGCSVSSSTSQFALQMQDGRTVKFDSVGNMRAQTALKEKKKWSEAASAGKPIRAKVGGTITGEKLTVVSVD